MNNSLYQNYYDYLSEEVVTPFYNDRLSSLNNLRLKDVLKRKNPYLFKAKNLELSGDLVKNIVDAFLSSQEETKFGNLLERFAIYVSQSLYGGFKSNFKSVDLEFERDGISYIVGIKSGTNWANSDQIAAMKSNFKIAKQNLRQKGVTNEIIAVNGCMYGRETVHLKNHIDIDKVYYKYAGQDFWYFISNDDNLYQEIIVPIDEKFKSAYAAKVNEMTQDFILNFMKNNQIDWVKLIDYVSKRGKFGLDNPIQTSLF